MSSSSIHGALKAVQRFEDAGFDRRQAEELAALEVRLTEQIEEKASTEELEEHKVHTAKELPSRYGLIDQMSKDAKAGRWFHMLGRLLMLIIVLLFGIFFFFSFIPAMMGTG